MSVQKIIGFKTSVTLPLELIPEENQHLHRKMEDCPHTTAVVRLCRVVDTFNVGDQGYHLVSNFSKNTYAIVEFEAILPIPFKIINKLKCSSYFYHELIGVNLNDHWIEQAKLQAILLNWNEAQDFTMLVNHFNTYKNNEDEPK